MLSTLRIETGSLDQVASILKVFGMVNVAPGFGQLAKVMDGCTDQLVQVFGKDAGTPARHQEYYVGQPGACGLPAVPVWPSESAKPALPHSASPSMSSSASLSPALTHSCAPSESPSPTPGTAAATVSLAPGNVAAADRD